MYYEGLSVSHLRKNNTEIDQTLQREINQARNIQLKLLNGATPKVDKGEMIGSSLPARLIGGDYYDFYPMINGKIRIVIGDVMGKGIPAAMLMILTRGAFRTAAESMTSPGTTLTAMNQALYNDLRALKSFVTLFCADWDPVTEVLTYANAGHIMPLHINGNSHTVRELPKVSGIMVGGLPNQVYKEEKVSLNPNDTVLFYTDGILEAQNNSGEQYQLTRLKNILVENQNSVVGEIERSVIESVKAFTGGEPQKDDITMVVLKLNCDKSDITSFNSPMING